MPFSLDYRAHSEIGLVRSNNQDSAYVSPTMLVVADGMGGAAAGDLASAVAVRELLYVDLANRDSATRLDSLELIEAMRAALEEANADLADLMDYDPSMNGMGTTVCGVSFSGEHFGLAHIGDSRGYLLRDGQVTRLTHDHSYVQSLVDSGKITEDEATEHPHRSLLLRVLNGQATQVADYELLEAHEGDRLLFCTDGLCGLVSDALIGEILRNYSDLDQVVYHLTQAAHQGGGSDNITLALADVVPYSPALETSQPAIYGAAAEVEIPDIDVLGDGEETEPTVVSVPRTGTDLTPEEAWASDGPKPAKKLAVEDYEAMRYQPHEDKRKRRWWPLLVVLVVVLGLVTASFFGMRTFLAGQYYLSDDSATDQVAIYQGLPGSVLGYQLSKQVESTSIPLTDLPPYYAGMVRNDQLRYDSLELAQNEVNDLEQLAEKCRAERAAKPPAPSPGEPAPGESASESPTSSTSAGTELEECD